MKLKSRREGLLPLLCQEMNGGGRILLKTHEGSPYLVLGALWVLWSFAETREEGGKVHNGDGGVAPLSGVRWGVRWCGFKRR